MTKIRVCSSYEFIRLSPDPAGERFSTECHEIQNNAIKIKEDIKCVELSDMGRVGKNFTSIITINTAKDKCSHTSSVDCNETIRDWFDVRHDIFHPNAGQLVYEGKNVPFLEKIKASGPKRIKFPLAASYVDVLE